MLRWRTTVTSASDMELALLSLVTQKTNSAVIVTDAQGYIEWVNEGFVRMTGYELEEVKGRKPGSFLQGPGTDPATVTLIREHLCRAEPIVAEILNYTREGVAYWIRLDIVPLLEDDGRVSCFVAFQTDMSKEYEQRQHLRRAGEQLGRMYYAQSHLLRRPLANIIGLVEVFPRSGLDKEQAYFLDCLSLSAHDLDKTLRELAEQDSRTDADD